MRRVRLGPALACCLLGSGAFWGAAAQAQGRAQSEDVDPEARQRFQLATTLYAQGRFMEAADEFERVYELTGNAVLLHNIYVAYRDAGDASRAAEFLRKYLDEAEEMGDRAVMEGRLATLERQIEAERRRAQALAEAQEERNGQVVGSAAPEGAVAVAPAQPSVPPAPSPAAAPEEPSILGPVVLMSAGGALLIGGAAAGLIAMQQYGELEDDCGRGLVCAFDDEEEVDSLATTTLVADVLLGAGTVSAAAGLIWLLVLPDGSREMAGPGLTCDGRGCLASWRGELP